MGGGGALEAALAAGIVGRVTDGRAWYYRVTPAGKRPARPGRLPVLKGTRREVETADCRVWSVGTPGD